MQKLEIANDTPDIKRYVLWLSSLGYDARISSGSNYVNGNLASLSDEDDSLLRSLSKRFRREVPTSA